MIDAPGVGIDAEPSGARGDLAPRHVDEKPKWTKISRPLVRTKIGFIR